MANNCLSRAFKAGLRWCGIDKDIPEMQWEDEAKAFAEQCGLSFTRLDEKSYRLSDSPVILIYRDNYLTTDAEYHAVFLSDSALLNHTQILNYAIIHDFENVRKPVNP